MRPTTRVTPSASPVIERRAMSDGIVSRIFVSAILAGVIAGVFLGAAAWWFLLASIASILRQRFTDNGLRWMNGISGVVILGFGVYALLSLVWR